MFQIIHHVTTYCPIYGGMNGSRAVRLPMAYRNEALARKLAARLHDENYNTGGDDSFSVVPYGASPYLRASTGQWPKATFDDIPF